MTIAGAVLNAASAVNCRDSSIDLVASTTTGSAEGCGALGLSSLPCTYFGCVSRPSICSVVALSMTVAYKQASSRLSINALSFCVSVNEGHSVGQLVKQTVNDSASQSTRQQACLAASQPSKQSARGSSATHPASASSVNYAHCPSSCLWHIWDNCW